MGYCVVFGCTTTDGCGRSLHSFPKCRRVRSEWIAAVRRKDFQPTKFSAICAKHFLPSAFTMDPNLAKQCGYKRAMLRADAVPTEHLPSAELNLKRGQERSSLAVLKRRNFEVNNQLSVSVSDSGSDRLTLSVSLSESSPSVDAAAFGSVSLIT